MLKHEIEHRLYRSLEDAWLRDATGGSCLRILGACKPGPQLEREVAARPEAWSPRCLPPRKGCEAGPPDDRTRYVLYRVDGLDDEGSLAYAESVYAALWPDGEIVREASLAAELEAKLEATMRHLRADPWSYFESLAPLAEGALEAIVADPRLYHCRSPLSQVFLHYIGARPLPLGAWAELWLAGKAVARCPRCGGRAYIIAMRRGPSGAASRGFCGSCGRIGDFAQASSFAEAWEAARAYVKPDMRAFRIDSLPRRLGGQAPGPSGPGAAGA